MTGMQPIGTSRSSAQLLALSAQGNPRVPQIFLTLVKDKDDEYVVKTFHRLSTLSKEILD